MMISALLEELGFTVQSPRVLHCDNNSAVMTYATEVAEWRSPTLSTKYWHSRDYIDDGSIVIRHIPGPENNADLHTKWLPNPDHLVHTRWLGLYAVDLGRSAEATFLVLVYRKLPDFSGLRSTS